MGHTVELGLSSFDSVGSDRNGGKTDQQDAPGKPVSVLAANRRTGALDVAQVRMRERASLLTVTYS